jgi:putative sterol carrier protein
MKEVEKRVKAELKPEDLGNVTSSMMNIVENCPDGKTRYMYFRFENGEWAEGLVGTEDDEVATKKAEFIVIGDYETFAMISRGELVAREALMRNKIKLKGDMVKALQLATYVDKLNRVISTVPTEF